MTKKILRYVLFGLIFISTGLAGFYFGMIVVFNKPFISGINPITVNGLPGAYTVLSGSMEPTIKTGGLILSVPLLEYHAGDVVTFKEKTDSKTLVTHRVLAMIYNEKTKSFTYYTKGDANKSFDSATITGGQIIGKVVFGVPYLGYAANSVKDPKMFILFVIVPATIIVYEELKYLKKEIEKLVSGLRKKIKNQKNTLPFNIKNDKGANKLLIFVPVLGILIILSGVTGSFFTDTKISSGNTLATLRQFPTPTPSPTPSLSPTPNTELKALLYNSNSYTCPAGASDFNQPQLTDVTFTKDGSNIGVIVTLTGASPSSVYDIWLNQDPGACPLSSPTSTGAITTDPSGNGFGSASSTLVSGATKFWVSAVGGGQVLRSTAVSF